MPSKKRPAGSPRSWEVIIEKIESENRLTIEAVETARHTLEERLDRVDRESRERDADLATATRGLRGDIERIDTRLQNVETKVDTLVPLEGRVAALERRPA